MGKLIQQGAEAKVFLVDDIVIKNRIEKRYRHKILDEKIRKRRTRHEARLLLKCKSIGMNVPDILNLDDKGRDVKDENILKIGYIKGDKLSETLNSYDSDKQEVVMREIGQQVVLMHNNDIIHGDLTTSNIILQEQEDKTYVIDFGLGFISRRYEDKAVDLHLIKQALEAKHWQDFKRLFNVFIDIYKEESNDRDKILKQLEKVEARGRYKH